MPDVNWEQYPPVLVTTVDVRRYLRKIIETDLFPFMVLSYQELSDEAKLHHLALLISHMSSKMRQPNSELILKTLSKSFDTDWTLSGVETIGRIIEVQDTILHLPHVPLAQLCLIDDTLYAEVVGIKNFYVILSPFLKPFGIHSGSTGSNH